MNASANDLHKVWLPEPAYDSGWMNITNQFGEYFNITHNLDTAELMIDITGKTTSDGGTHQQNFGGTYVPGWTKIYGDSNEEAIWSIVQTNDGGYAAAGWKVHDPPDTSWDFWLVKYSPRGNVVWERSYSRPYQDNCYSMVYTSDGGFALAGWTYSFASKFDGWLVKTDANGNMEWNQTYGGTEFDGFRSLVQTVDGGYALAGYNNTISDISDFWLVKTDASGNEEWSRSYGGSGEDRAYSIIQTVDGGYAIVGHTESFGEDGTDLWLIKTDALGYMEWNQTYGGTADEGGVYQGAVIQTIDGGYAIASQTESYGAGFSDAWLVKTDVNGVALWNQTYGTDIPDGALSILQTPNQGYALAGWKRYDFWLIETDASGEIHRSEIIDIGESAKATCLTQTSDGGYALGGWTGNQEDIVFARTSSECGLMWTDSTPNSITVYKGRNDI